jgi:hypothetical protein
MGKIREIKKGILVEGFFPSVFLAGLPDGVILTRGSGIPAHDVYPKKSFYSSIVDEGIGIH